MPITTAPTAPVITLPHASWNFTQPDKHDLVDGLEDGKVLCFPQLAFELTPAEAQLLNPSLVDPKCKNISLNIDKNRLQGVAEAGNEPVVKALLERYYQHTHSLIETLLPEYRGKLLEPVNSLRVHEKRLARAVLALFR